MPIFIACAAPISLLCLFRYGLGRWQIEQAIASIGQTRALAPVVDPGNVTIFLLQAGILGSWPIILEVALGATAAVSLHRLALFEGRRPHLRPGRIEVSFVTLAVLTAFATVAFTLLVTLTTMWIAKPIGGWTFLIVLLAWVGVVVVSVRFAPIFPIIVAEGKISIGRTLGITEDNWWRMFAVGFVGSLPFWLINFFIHQTLAAPMTEPVIMSDEWIRGALHSQLDRLPLIAVIGGLQYVASVALGVVLLSYSYKKLIGRDYADVLEPPT